MRTPISRSSAAALFLAASVSAQDFNGDGYADLAIGVPHEDVGGVTDAGAVSVLYGGAAGLSAAGDQFWSLDSAGVLGSAQAYGDFGASLAGGDFDGDGYDDLAIGVPAQDVGGVADAGTVHVLRGSAGGLTAAGDQRWSQNSTGIPDQAETGDGFGASLASGDFNGDGYADLAIGVSSEGLAAAAAGAVQVLYGGAGGLSAAGNQLWSQDSAGILDQEESGDHFGATLAAGDFNGDGDADLAVGAPDEALGALASAGAVNVLYGAAGGLSASGNQFWSQDTTGVLGVAAAADLFGFVLAAGDCNGDGSDELAVGVPNETVGSASAAGAVNVLYGGAGGLDTAGNQLWSQDSTGVQGAAESDDAFGLALAMVDFNGDGAADLAVGVPFEDLSSQTDAGAVNVLYGGAGGLSSSGNQVWDQDSAGIAGKAEAYDEFGLAVSAGDFRGNGRAGLAIGVPRETVGSALSCGAVQVLRGAAGGLTSTSNQLWTQNSSGILDSAENGDNFGSAL